MEDYAWFSLELLASVEFDEANGITEAFYDQVFVDHINNNYDNLIKKINSPNYQNDFLIKASEMLGKI